MSLDQCFLLPFSILCSLSSVPSQDPSRAHCSEGQNELLSVIKAWQVPPEGASLPLVQSAKDLKEILCTAAAFLQGLWGTGTHASAVSCCSVPGPLSLPFLVSLPKQTCLWGFLGCFFGSRPGLSLQVSTFTFHIQKPSLIFPSSSFLCTITGLLCLSVTLGEVSEPCSDLKAERCQGICEDFPFFFLSSGTALLQARCSHQIMVLQEPHKVVVRLCSLVSQQAVGLLWLLCSILPVFSPLLF